ATPCSRSFTATRHAVHCWCNMASAWRKSAGSSARRWRLATARWSITTRAPAAHHYREPHDELCPELTVNMRAGDDIAQRGVRHAGRTQDPNRGVLARVAAALNGESAIVANLSKISATANGGNYIVGGNLIDAGDADGAIDACHRS